MRRTAPPPATQFGFLPFYTRERSPGSVSENYLVALLRLHGAHLARPLQRAALLLAVPRPGPRRRRGRGALGPVLHPLQRQGHRLDLGRLAPLAQDRRGSTRDIRQTKTQFFYFLYWSARRRRACRARRRRPPTSATSGRSSASGTTGPAAGRSRSRARWRSSSPTTPTSARAGRRSSPSTATTAGPRARRAARSSGTRSPGGATPRDGLEEFHLGPAPRHAQAALGPELDHLRIRFWGETGQG